MTAVSTPRTSGPGAVAEPEPRTRAAALPPDERRAAIVAAAVPLLVEHGEAVSTRQIAEAAGVAEGTIFRVFPDKPAVLRAAVEAAWDTGPFEAAVEAIDRSAPVEQQLVEAVRLLQARVARIWRLMPIARDIGMITPGERRRPPDVHVLADLFAPIADQLRLPPDTAARRLRSLAMATSYPFEPDGPVDPAEVVSMLLDGVRLPAPRSSR